MCLSWVKYNTWWSELRDTNSERIVSKEGERERVIIPEMKRTTSQCQLLPVGSETGAMVEGAHGEENDQGNPIDPRIPEIFLGLGQRTEQVQHVQTGRDKHLWEIIVVLELRSGLLFFCYVES